MKLRVRLGHTIRGRIIRIVAPPLVAMVLLLGFFSAGEISSYRAAAATEDRVTVILALQSLVQELQNERGVTVAVLAGNAEFRAELDPARRRVDSRRVAVESVLAGGGRLEDRAAESVSKLDELARLRGGADTGEADRDDTFEFYTGLIGELSEETRHLEIVSDEALRRGAESVEQLVEIREATAQERVFLLSVFTAGGFRAGEFSKFLNIIAARDLYLDELGEFASPETAAAMTKVLGTADAATARALERKALGSGDGRSLTASPRAWWAALATVLDDLTRLAQQVGVGTQGRAETLREQATVRLGLLSIVVLLCLAGSVFLATAGTRSLAVPLATLAGEANRLARDHLPAAVGRAVAGDAEGPPGPLPVEPGATDEVRQVADAFGLVQETAYTLATEQAKLRRTTAESLANLGHRNQNLLRRQLGFITRLEQEESDPSGLANLFELDHLATRMRRNAESLLVLVGAASPRQWSGQLPLTDVIRAAVSEVEEYRRVILRRMDDALVPGRMAGGLAHMLAELIENGLAFSPPDVEVEIHGRLLGGDYLIAVCDQGVGMSEDELRRANGRLRGDGDFLTVPARLLGHYVVGRLAAEMGVQVQLTPSPVIGITARIHLPAGILTATPPVADVAPPRPAERQLTPAEAPAKQIRPRPLDVDFIVVEPAGAQSFDRTPNGLRKRLPREQRSRPAVVPAQRSEPSPEVGDSPGEVGARLMALRDGVQRAEADRVGHP
jgi:signal transduction histidine kinase